MTVCSTEQDSIDFGPALFYKGERDDESSEDHEEESFYQGRDGKTADGEAKRVSLAESNKKAE